MRNALRVTDRLAIAGKAIVGVLNLGETAEGFHLDRLKKIMCGLTWEESGLTHVDAGVAWMCRDLVEQMRQKGLAVEWVGEWVDRLGEMRW